MTRIPALLLAGAIGLAAAPSLAASVSTGWARVTQGNQEECLATAMRAVQSVGFSASISDSRQTVFGWRGDEALTVQCLSAHGVAVVFSWVTDQSNDSARLVENVTAAFRNRGQPGGGGLTGSPGGGTFGGGLGGGNLTGGGGNLTGGGGGGNLTGGGGAPGGSGVKR